MRPKRFLTSVVLVSAIAAAMPVVAALDLDAPTADIHRPRSLTDVVTVLFDEDVRDVTSENLVLRLADGGATVATSLRCLDNADEATACEGAGSLVRVAILDPSSALVPGQRYRVVVNPDGAAPITDLVGEPVTPTSRRFVASSHEQESSVAASYRWRRFAASRAYGDSFRAESSRGASTTVRFTGGEIVWYTVVGPKNGRADVYIDGTKRATVNNYASTERFKIARRFSGLGDGKHRLTILVRGERGSSSGTGTWIAVDGFRADGAFIGQNVARYRWDRVDAGRASGDRYVRTATPGSRVSFRFRGKGIDWYATMGPDQGIAAVYVDGVRKRTVDLYSSTRRYGVRIPFAGLTDDVHTMRIVATGDRNRSSSGRWISVDRWILRLPTIKMYRDLGAWVDLYDTGVNVADAVATLDANRVRTVYLQTARWNSTSDIVNAAWVGEWLERAHAAGIKVVGWYLPAYDQWLDRDVRRTLAIRSFRSANGHRFDSLAVDIEYKGETESLDEFNDGIRRHLARVRAGVGNLYPVGAIVPSPVGMAISPSSWTGFPWASIGRYADVVLPMGYWSYRIVDGRCDADSPEYCAYGYTAENIRRARSFTKLPVHDIGGIARYTKDGQTKWLSVSDLEDFARACGDARAYGCSIYDYATMRSSQWPPLAPIAS